MMEDKAMRRTLLEMKYKEYRTADGYYTVETEFLNCITGAQETKVYKGRTAKEAWTKTKREATRLTNKLIRIYG